ncbi:MAG: glycosyltransferase, partial [Acidobacteria bacterium]|nr:glycosyltransferase [Acidobacteriota bacterium]
MKIALLNSCYYPDEPGGAERSVRILAESLVGAGHTVSVICLGKARETTEVGGVRVERIPIRNGYLPSEHGGDRGAIQRVVWHVRDTHNSAAAHDIAVLLHQFRPDVLHTNNLSGFSVSVWKAARDLGIRIMHTTRDFYLLCPRSTMM